MKDWNSEQAVSWCRTVKGIEQAEIDILVGRKVDGPKLLTKRFKDTLTLLGFEKTKVESLIVAIKMYSIVIVCTSILVPRAQEFVKGDMTCMEDPEVVSEELKLNQDEAVTKDGKVFKEVNAKQFQKFGLPVKVNEIIVENTMTKDELRARIVKSTEEVVANKNDYAIFFYSGPGQREDKLGRNGGNICSGDGENLSLEEFFYSVKEAGFKGYVTIVLNCPYSGNWSVLAKKLWCDYTG